jgi:hypothetical protein
MSELGTNSSSTINEYQAAALVGLAIPELLWFSRMLGLGHKHISGSSVQTVFTYEELKRLSSEAATSDE